MQPDLHAGGPRRVAVAGAGPTEEASAQQGAVPGGNPQPGASARDTRVLVACSGGPDSVALVHVLSRLSAKLSLALEVASVDHGLRPESEEEVRAVGRFAADLGLPFHPVTLRGLSGAPGSLQGVARRARYEALTSLAHTRGMHAIAVGHTQDDQAETVVARLMRGAGLRGLSAIAPVRDDGVTRPLIDAKRSDVEAWVRGNGLPVCYDPSNDDPRYERVRIRRTLMPLLRAENPEITTHLANLADEARETSEFVAVEARVRLEDVRRDGGLDLARLRNTPGPVLDALLALHVERSSGQPAKRAHVDALADLVMRSPRARVRLREGYWGWREAGLLVLGQPDAGPGRERGRRAEDPEPE